MWLYSLAPTYFFHQYYKYKIKKCFQILLSLFTDTNAEKLILLENENQNLSMALNSVQLNLDRLSTEQEYLRQNYTEQNLELASVKQELMEQRKGVSNITAEMENKKISFSVYLSGTSSYLANYTLPFSENITNNGNHFNTSAYTFTCPVSGYYYFIVCLCNGYLGGSYEVSCISELMVEELQVLQIDSYKHDYRSISTNRIYDQACNAAITFCNVNETAYVRTITDSNIQTGTRSFFSGYFLHSL